MVMKLEREGEGEGEGERGRGREGERERGREKIYQNFDISRSRPIWTLNKLVV